MTGWDSLKQPVLVLLFAVAACFCFSDGAGSSGGPDSASDVDDSGSSFSVGIEIAAVLIRTLLVRVTKGQLRM